MCFIVPCLSQIESSTAVARRLKQALVVHCSICWDPIQCCQLSQIMWENQVLDHYLPVSRLEYEIFWIIAERLPFLVDSTFRQWNFKYFALFELLFLMLTLNVSSQTPVCYFNITFFSSILRHRKYSRQSESRSVFTQMTSCAVRYHVIYHPFHVNSQYL